MPQEDPQDILIVQNIDLNCDDIDPEEGWSHADFFQVRWAGHPHRIRPGETRRMPRYVAEHFAKHLADHILMKMERETGRQFLVNHPIERPKVLKQILVGVDEYFLQQEQKPAPTEGERVAEEIEKLNEPEKVLDVGEVPPPAIGVLKEPPKEVEIPEETEETPTGQTSIVDPSKPLPTRVELMKECKRLGIPIRFNETKESLIAKLKNF